MALFEKKFCDICGEKIGLMGNRKLEDGNLCKDCAAKLSPFFSDRRQSTVAEIREQLDYRERNRENLKNFSPSRVLGNNMNIYIDDMNRQFVASRRSDYKSENADIIGLDQVSNVRYEVEEHRTEIYTKDSEGKRISYNPPRYKYTYGIIVYIYVNHPYFDEIHFEITNTNDRPESRQSQEFHNAEYQANEIIAALRGQSFGGMGMNNMNGQFSAGMGFNQQGLNQQGFNQQGFPQQNFQQGYPQQNFQQGFPQQNMQQGFPQQNFQQQGFPQQNMQQNFQQQGFPQQNMQQGFPQQNFQQQGFPQQNMQQGFPQQQNFQQQGFPQSGPQQGFGQPTPMNNETWICPMCGSASTSKFCPNCGAQKQN